MMVQQFMKEFIMRHLILLFCLLTFITAGCLAQTGCTSKEYSKIESTKNPGLVQKAQDLESFIKNWSFYSEPRMVASGIEGNGLAVIKIPVVVHVLYNSVEQKITEEQVRSQLDVLNRDYRMLNTSVTELPDYFKSLAADCFIEFTPATIDPQGRPTRGIVWKKTNNSYFGSDDGIKFSRRGGDDAWDADRYLNIWVGKLSPGMVGYSSPIGASKEKDGIVLRYSAFGTLGTATAPYNLGRTAVHEIGHWLGLKHIWGDRFCGDDEVADTPPQKGPTPGCPSGVTAAACDNSASGSMYMNFMDVTYDACTNMFTNGQRDRMRALFAEGGPRHALLYSQGSSGPLLPMPVELPVDSFLIQSVIVYPNPADNTITVNTGAAGDLTGDRIRIHNHLGQLVLQSNITAKTMQLNISSFRNGLYYLKIGAKSKAYKLVKASLP
ncbi:MAG: T9SS type A sorting domain-containing protein [Chitinophagaceae bacterium]|nr:T9SS type A sorting domain-containing protein [Chitinophagaceae bacterium]